MAFCFGLGFFWGYVCLLPSVSHREARYIFPGQKAFASAASISCKEIEFWTYSYCYLQKSMRKRYCFKVIFLTILSEIQYTRCVNEVLIPLPRNLQHGVLQHLPIWHWYMFRGLWLWSEKGMRLATTLKMLWGKSSWWVVTPGTTSDSSVATFMKICKHQIG